MKTELYRVFIAVVMVLAYGSGVSMAELPITDGLIAHLDGDHVVLDPNGLVEQLVDQSGQGNHAYQNVKEKRPSLVSGGANGYNALKFDADDTNFKAMMIYPSSDFETDRFTWFVVFRLSYATLNTIDDILMSGYEMGWGTNRRSWGSYCEYDSIRSNVRSTAGGWVGEYGGWEEGTFGWNLVIGMWDPQDPNDGTTEAVDGDFDAYINPLTTLKPSLADAKCSLGNAVTTYTGVNNLTGHWGTCLGNTISSAPTGTFPDYVYTYDINWFRGEIAEVIVYGAELTTLELESVASYLKNKYDYGEITSLSQAPNNCDSVQAAGDCDLSDITKDCTVDLDDFSVFATKWLTDNVPY